MKRKAPPRLARRFAGLLEELEPRILFSADAVAVLLPASGLPATDMDQAIQQLASSPSIGSTPQSSTTSQDVENRVELVFVDSRVPDAQALIRLIEQQSSATGRVLEVHWLSDDADGVDQITRVLNGRQDVSALHIISHGSDGSLTLGQDALNTQSLPARASDLSQWSAALSTDADILLYGCDVATTEVGFQFLKDLSLLTGADVAASNDATGHASLGGDWSLEWHAGQVETQTVLGSDLAATWAHILPTLTLQDGLNGYTGTVDTYLYTSTGIGQNVDRSTSTTLLAGEDGTGGQAQTLIKFDISQIPTGSTINSVTLTMRITTAATFTNPTYNLHRMLVSWSDTDTWTTMGDGITEAFPAEASATTDSSITENGAGSYTFANTANLRNTVQGWVNGTTSNQGWYFTNGDYSSRMTLASSENATTANRPILTIDYTAPAPPAMDLDANNSTGATGSSYSGAFVENGAAARVADTDATLTSGSSLSGMTVTIGNLLNGTAESLDATLSGSITKSYNSATGVLTLSGTDTAANYQAVLRSITYNNSSDTPNTTARTINIVATNIYAQTASATSTLSVTATNDAPVITSGGGGPTAGVSVAETLTAVTTVTSTDPEGTARTYSIVAGGDGTRFSINASTGVLTFVSAPDYEAPTDTDANNSYVVTVQASDGSLSDTQTITVTVTDVVSTLTVTTVADTNDTTLGGSFTAEQLNAAKGTDGLVSLREAIIAANTTIGTDTINFAITGTTGGFGEYTIATTSALPTITQSVIINGASQTGYTNRPLIVLDGAGGGAYGLELSNTADGSTIRGLLIRDYGSYGLYINSGSDDHTIVGNYIGSFNADGSNAGVGKGNGAAGIYSRGANVLIGGTTAADRNVISGNGSYNVYLTTDANGTIIRGNYIGTNSAGSSAFSTTNPNYGILVDSSATNVVIGGTAAGAGNVISGHLREGVWVSTSGTVTLQGNYLGTNATGTSDLGNGRYGIYLDATGTATIGGTVAGAGNVISGNDLGGIYASNGNVLLQGNTIGLNAAGTAALGNTGSGVELRTSSASTIGGNTAAARNIISGNSSHGILVESSQAHIIRGNYIGTGANGTTLLGNGGAGIYINASGVLVGGKGLGDGNLIAGNGGAGIAVASGNGNLFYQNSIHSNSGLGIDLVNDGVTANDDNDGDGGANYRNNFPVITSVVTNGSSTVITGSIDWYTESQPVYIELFSNTSADASGHGEGRTYLGFVQVTTDAITGDATFSLTVTGVSVGDWITAVANIEGGFIGASEFARAVQSVTPANAPRGRLIWNNNDRFYQYYADWSSAGFGGTGVNGLSFGDDISMIMAAEAPTRNEILFIGASDVSGKILAGIWNGSSWSSVISIPIADPGADASSQNSFAVAYDELSGNAMLVWDNGTTGTAGLSYAIWNGTTWSATATITAPVSGEPLHMQLAASPNSHEMMLVVETAAASNNQYAIVWNGSSWGNAQTLGSNSSKQYFELNVAYERQSGQAMVIYDASGANSSSVQYRTWDGSTWSAEGTVAAPAGTTGTSELYTTVIASDAGSDRIAIGAKNALNEVWFSVWDGSAWGTGVTATTSGVALTDQHATMAVAFESQSGDLLAVYGKAAGPNIYYRTWTSGGGWSAEGTGPSMGGTDVPYVAKLYADPYSNTIMLGVQDGASDLNMVTWDGSAWGTVTELDAATGHTYRENFTYVWYRDAPVITNLDGETLSYSEDSAATPIDQGGNASVVLGSELNYDGGNLTVSFTSGSTSAEDVLGIRNQGTGGGQIGLSGANVTYGGTVIGTYSGGSLGSNLVITLNANATDVAVSALISNITYANANTSTPSTTDRNVRFVVTNQLGHASANCDVTVTVTAVNDAPVNSVPGSQSTNEDTALTFSGGNGNLISISDVDAGSASVQVSLSVSNGTLSLSGITGLSFSVGDGTGDASMVFSGTISAINTALAGLTYTPTANYNGSDSLSITTSDLGNAGSGGTQTDTDLIAITVNAVNDAPVISSNGGGASASVNVAENATAVTTVVASDLEGTAITYSISGGADAGKFTINASTGALSFVSAPDFESPTDVGGNNVYDVIVQASDGSLTDTQSIAVTVTATNDNSPVITSNGGGASASVNVAENATAVTTVTATDGDLPSQTLSYSISGGADSALFSINTTTGVLTFTSGRNRESATDANADHVYEVTVQASDGTNTDTQAISVTVTDVDEFDVGAITDVNATANSVAENAANGTLARITARATDADATNNTITYTLSNNAGGRFAINSSTGVVTVANGTLLDREAAASHSITVLATSADGSTRSQAFTINLSDVDEFNVGPVTDVNAAANNVAENAGNGTAVGITASASDADATTNAITYTLSDTAGGRFAVNSTTGVVTVADGTLLNYEAATSHSITVLATSADGSSSSQSFTINLTDADEFNVGAVTDVNAAANSVTENTANGTVVGITANAVDADGTTNTVTYTLSDNAGGRFAINSSTGVITVANSTLLNYEAAASHSVTVLATSADGSTSTLSVTVNLTDANEFNVSPVTDIDGAANSVVENAANGTVVGITANASDADASTNTVTYSLSNSAGGRFSIDSNTGVVTVANSTLLDFESSAAHTITVVATSQDGSSSLMTLTINLIGINDHGPTISSPAQASVTELTTSVTRVVASDADLPTQTLTYYIAGGLDASQFLIDAVTGDLSFVTPPAFDLPADQDQNNRYEVIVGVSDGVLSQTLSMQIEVRQVATEVGPPIGVQPPIIPDLGTNPPLQPPLISTPGDGGDTDTPTETPTEAEPEAPTTTPGESELAPERDLTDQVKGQSPGSGAYQVENFPIASQAWSSWMTMGAPNRQAMPGQAAGMSNVELQANAMPTLTRTSVQINPWSSGPSVTASNFFFDATAEGSGALVINPTITALGGVSLSLGLVWWATRASALVSSLLITTPAWRTLDPLPIFMANSKSPDDEGTEHTEDEAERMFDEPPEQEHAMQFIH